MNRSFLEIVRPEGRSARSDEGTSAATEALVAFADDDLLLLARGGAGHAFDEIVRRYQERALRCAARYLGDANLAREAAQRAFVEVHGFLARYEPRGRFPQFFFRVLVNQCKLLRRAQAADGRRREALLRESQASPELPDERLLTRERRRELTRAVAQLSEKLRSVVILRYAGELGYEEIAETLELPVGTVKSRLAAAMLRLREHLGDFVP